MDAQTIKSLVAIFLAAILTENYILNKFLGICPFLGVSKKLDTAVGMSCAVTVVMVISTAVTWPLYNTRSSVTAWAICRPLCSSW